MISRIPALLASAALIVSLAACDSFTPDSGGVASSDIGMNDCLPYLTASGASIDTGCGGGGGGGGLVLRGLYVEAGSYPALIGAGGAGADFGTASRGSPSSIFGIEALGGGGGGGVTSEVPCLS